MLNKIKKNWQIVLLAVLIVGFLTWYFKIYEGFENFAFLPESDSLGCTWEFEAEQEQEQSGGGSQSVATIFYAPWCSACKSVMPTWEQLEKKLKDHPKVKFNRINGAENKAIMEKYGIAGYPTIYLFKQDDAIEYSGDRSLESLEKFVLSRN